MARRTPPSRSNTPIDDGFRPNRSNRVLDMLSDDAGAALKARLTEVSFTFDQIFYGYGDAIERVYFPVTAVASLTLTMEDGRTVEVGTIGNEGIVGLPVFLGQRRSPTTVLCQIAGTALSMTADTFRAATTSNPTFLRGVEAASHASNVQAMHSAGCNRLHSVEQRMARWLLMTQDRVGLERLPLTQQFIAYMLGVYRPTVTLTALALQKVGLIEYQRGAVTILDRRGLEEVACECYAVVRSETDRLLLPAAADERARA